MTISREKLGTIIINYFLDLKGMHKEQFYKEIGYQNSVIKNWQNGKAKIQDKSIRTITGYIEEKGETKDFISYIVRELEIDGYRKEIVTRCLSEGGDKPLHNKIKKLLSNDLMADDMLMDELGTQSILQDLQDLLAQYREFVQIDEIENLANVQEEINKNSNAKSFFELVHLDSNRNYTTVKMPSGYRIGILLSNNEFGFDSEKDKTYHEGIKLLRSQFDLKMILVFTDFEERRFPFDKRMEMLNEYNLIYEFISFEDLNAISVKGFHTNEIDEKLIKRELNRFRYAQMIFERFMSYLAVIDNDIVFLPHCKTDEIERISGYLQEETKNQTVRYAIYAKDTLMKTICHYSYLARHTIYYERSLVAGIVDKVLQERAPKKKLPLVVEVCAPNSLTTSNIVDKCERILLFTGSHYAYKFMRDVDGEEKRFLPDNVELCLCPMKPDAMVNKYPDELKGKVDLLVLGYGAGSQISDLSRFVRYAYNWLNENGVMIISVQNKESIVLNKFLLRDQRFESKPAYISDYWAYMPNEHVQLLKKMKAYSKVELRTVCSTVFEMNGKDENMYTYPYISALINPDDYSRQVLDEIREADKSFASRGLHGLFINGVARKNSHGDQNERDKIYVKLKEGKINHNIYEHILAPDTKALKNSLKALANASNSYTTLMKTVVFVEKTAKKEEQSMWFYVILPCDDLVKYNKKKYEMVFEKLVTAKYGEGSVSPLKIWLEAKNDKEMQNRVVLFLGKAKSTKFVIMAGESNYESVRILTKDLRRMYKEIGVNASDGDDNPRFSIRSTQDRKKMQAP